MKVLDEYGLASVEDREVGIEVEMEGENLPGYFPRVWRGVGDGSLRGHSLEYVLKKPCKRGQVLARLKYLEAFFNECGSVLNPSDRCGVHIHINCQQLSFIKTMNFVIMYLILESLLIKWCGEDREGNLFCLSATDAEFLLIGLKRAMQKGTFRDMMVEDFRYASINVTSLAKYGSIEFRSMRSPKNIQDIKVWVDLLLKVFDSSQTFNSPRDIVETLSAIGAKQFVNQVMGRKTHRLKCPNMEQLIMDGVRMAQEVAFIPREERAKAQKRINLEPGGLNWREVPGEIIPDRPVRAGARKRQGPYQGQNFIINQPEEAEPDQEERERPDHHVAAALDRIRQAGAERDEEEPEEAEEEHPDDADAEAADHAAVIKRVAAQWREVVAEEGEDIDNDF